MVLQQRKEQVMRIGGYILSYMDADKPAIVIFFQGCKRNCKGCHNPEMQDINGGFEREIDELWKELDKTFHFDWIDTIVLSGGEPTEQPEALKEIAKRAKMIGKEVWLYSGHFYEELNDDVLENVDVIIDGPYLNEKRTEKMNFRGSSNQRMWKKIDTKNFELIDGGK